MKQERRVRGEVLRKGSLKEIVEIRRGQQRSHDREVEGGILREEELGDRTEMGNR